MAWTCSMTFRTWHDRAEREALGLEGEQREVGAGERRGGDAPQAGRRVDDHDVAGLLARRERLLEGARPARPPSRTTSTSVASSRPRGRRLRPASRVASDRLGGAWRRRTAARRGRRARCRPWPARARSRPAGRGRRAASVGLAPRTPRPGSARPSSCRRRPSGSRSPRGVPSAPPRCGAKCSTTCEVRAPRGLLRRRAASPPARISARRSTRVAAEPLDELRQQRVVGRRLERAHHLGPGVDQVDPEQQVREAAHAPDAVVQHEVDRRAPLAQDRLEPGRCGRGGSRRRGCGGPPGRSGARAAARARRGGWPRPSPRGRASGRRWGSRAGGCTRRRGARSARSAGGSRRPARAAARAA